MSSNSSFSQGAVLLENISRLQDNIHRLRSEAEQLNRTVEEEELDPVNQTQMLTEVRSVLETIRGVNLTASRAEASQELRWV